jgi:hypothetical protein
MKVENVVGVFLDIIWSCEIKKGYPKMNFQITFCTAYGIRTRANAVKGRRPRPLDERGIEHSNKWEPDGA